MNDFARLIEHAFPLKQTSLDSVHEKNVRHGHISTLHIWPARRPLAACRAALIATLLPDPSAQPKPEGMSDAQWQEEIKRRRRELCEKIAGKVVKKTEKKKMPNGQTVERIKEETEGGILHWGRETENADTLEWFRQEIRKAYGGRAPKVLDPFAGGGAIPLEAMRLGCEATAVDINPVAWFILKCTLEYPQKLAGQTRPLPDFILENEEFMEAFYKANPGSIGKGKATKKQKDTLFVDAKADHAPEADLAWHVRAWGQWVLDRARRELAQYYPTYADFLPASGLRPSAQTGLPAHLPINRRSPFFVYILKCSDGSFYIGQTEDLGRRFNQHLNGEVSWTASRRPVELIHWEEYSTREQAVRREEALKTGFGRTWIRREYEARRLRVQIYDRRLVPLTEDGLPDIERLNREFVDPFLGPHDWGRPVKNEGTSQAGPACAERSEAGRWVAKPTVAYLWARTVTCKNCRATVPLLKTRWLCKKANKRVLLTMEPNADKTGVVFGVEAHVPIKGGNAARKREHDKRIGAGTMSRAGTQCPCCATINTMEDIRLEGKAGRLGSIMTAVVVDGPDGKEYRLPTEHERAAAAITEEQVQEAFKDVPFGVPDEPTPSENALGMRVPLYGFDKWRKLFTPRQLVALGRFVAATRAARDEMAQQQVPAEWIEGVGAYLALVIDKVADYNSTVCVWHLSRELIGHTFTRFALPITWDFSEIPATNDTGGAYSAQLDWSSRYIDHALIASANAELPHPINRSARSIHDGTLDAIITDPPYYDAIPYSDLMDFFYIWLRRSLHSISSSIDAAFLQELSPKWDHEANDGELIDDCSRHGNDAALSKRIYEDGMAQVFSSCCTALKPEGRVVVVFANKQPDAWETLVSAIIRAGFVVECSWPIQTEMSTRMRAKTSAALASSVWLAARKRPATARPGWDNHVLEEMRAKITVKLREFWDAGIRGPDFVWAATGPALEAYSKHPVVRKANEPNATMSVGEFLNHVRRMVVDYIVGQVLTGEQGADLSACDAQAGMAAADRLDEVTAYYLLHRHDFGMDEAPVGACILYATACGLTDGELDRTWDILTHAGGGGAVNDEDVELGEDSDGDAESEDGSGGGSKVKLKAWSQRRGRSMGYEAPDGKPVPLIDRIHRVMHLWKEGDVQKVDEYLDQHALRRNELFKRVVQSLIELSTNSERSLLESISNHIGAKGAVKDRGPVLFDENE